MIEVTIWWGNIHGDSSSAYLVRTTPTPFKSHTNEYTRCVNAALTALTKEQPNAVIERVQLRGVPDNILELPACVDAVVGADTRKVVQP